MFNNVLDEECKEQLYQISARKVIVKLNSSQGKNIHYNTPDFSARTLSKIYNILNKQFNNFQQHAIVLTIKVKAIYNKYISKKQKQKIAAQLAAKQAFQLLATLLFLAGDILTTNTATTTYNLVDNSFYYNCSQQLQDQNAL